MPVNPNILLGLQQPQLQLPDPNAGMNALARAMQIKSLSDEQKMRAQSMADTTALNEAYRGAYGADGQVDRNKLLGDLAGRGLGSKIPSIQKSFLEVDDKTADIKKKEADRLKTELETTLKKAEHVSSVLSLARDPASYAQVRQVIAQTYGQQLPEQFDPGLVQATIAQGQTLTQRLAAEHQRLTLAETGRHNVATEGLTARGQDVSTANNQRTVGASYANAAATREIANATRDAAGIRDKRDVEMKLADDYRAQSKNFKDVVDASNRVKSALPSATKSAASTLAAATSFMKMLDPGSVVRESELGMALAATGAIDRLTNYHNTLAHGKVLTPDQAKDFGNITEKVLEAAKQGQQAVDANYRGQAKQYGLRPEMIIQDLGQDKPAPAPKPTVTNW